MISSKHRYINYIYWVIQKKILFDLEEKCLRNSEVFFDGVFPSLYSHLLKKLELFKLCRNQGQKVVHKNVS